MHSLPLFHRISGRPVIVVGEGDTADAKRRLVERAGGSVVGESGEARLAFVASDDAEAAAARLRERGILVNVVDRPELCDFTTPSVLERGSILVAVASGGASAGLAKAVRLRLETLLPQGLGALASALAQGREAIRRRWPDAAGRRRALDAALAEGGALDPLREHDAGAVEAWLVAAAESQPEAAHTFTLLSDDPDDLTLRQARLLGTADVVRYGSGISSAILARARADAVRRPLDDPARDYGIVVILRRA